MSLCGCLCLRPASLLLFPQTAGTGQGTQPHSWIMSGEGMMGGRVMVKSQKLQQQSTWFQLRVFQRLHYLLLTGSFSLEVKKLGGEGAGLRFQGWELAEKVREAGLTSQALLSTPLTRTVLFYIPSTCVSRAFAAFGGSPLSQEAPDARAGGSGARGQSPDLSVGLQLGTFPGQHIMIRPGLLDHRDFWKEAEQERKVRKACPLGGRA